MNNYVSHADLVTFADRSVNLSASAAQTGRDRVNTLRDRLGKYIDEHPGFDLVKMLHAGSVAKGTALRTLNDMDVAVYVVKADAPDDAGLIDWLTERLREAYGGLVDREQIQPGTHCVTVSFRSQGGLDVDVVPVLYEGDPDDCGYLIARDTGDRLLTSVRLHLEFIRKRKANNPKDFAQIVQFVKWWVKQQRNLDDQFRFKSFMVELVVAHLADSGVAMTPYPTALREVFGYIAKSRLGEQIAFADYHKLSELPPKGTTPIEIFDPVNPANNVAHKYTTTQLDKIASAADEAWSAIIEAELAETKDQAVECWQVVFGPSFRV